MTRKTRRRGKGGKRVRGTRRVRRVRRVIRGRISRGGNRRYNSEGGGPFPTLDELGSQVRNIGSEVGELGSKVGELGRNAYTQASALGSNTLNRFTRSSAPAMQ